MGQHQRKGACPSGEPLGLSKISGVRGSQTVEAKVADRQEGRKDCQDLSLQKVPQCLARAERHREKPACGQFGGVTRRSGQLQPSLPLRLGPALPLPGQRP